MTALITGGAASGKSNFAENLAAACGGRKAYLATMRLWDGECRARVQKHRAMRAGKGFDTFECPTGEPAGFSAGRYDTALLEDLSNLAANVMFSGGCDVPGTAAFVGEKVEALRAKVQNLVVVSNEIFSGIGGYGAGTLAYMAALGELNRRLAAKAEIVVETVCGVPVFYKGKERMRVYEDLL